METKLYCQFVSFALKPLNCFNVAFQTSASKIGTLQQDVRNLLRSFLSNFVRLELLATTSNEDIHMFSYESPSNQLLNDKLGIGTATRLHLIENSDELEGTRREDNFYHTIRQFYVECVRKMIAKFPFADKTINDLCVLDPRHRYETSAASVTRLFKLWRRRWFTHKNLISQKLYNIVHFAIYSAAYTSCII